jgi:hypothetical protein
MNNQLTSNAEALRLFFTEDIYLVGDRQQSVSAEPVNQNTTLPVAIPPIEVNRQQQNLSATAIIAPTDTPNSKARKFNFEYLGKNQKRILILVNDKINKVSSPLGTELLRKLVKAIALTNNDFALVNFAHYPGATFEDLNEFFNCELVLSFGVEAPLLGLAPQPLHQLAQLLETRLIFTANLDELDRDTASKKILWTTLQRLNNDQ